MCILLAARHITELQKHRISREFGVSDMMTPIHSAIGWAALAVSTCLEISIAIAAIFIRKHVIVGIGCLQSFY